MNLRMLMSYHGVSLTIRRAVLSELMSLCVCVCVCARAGRVDAAADRQEARQTKCVRR